MRYPPNQKAKAKAAILKAGAEAFREKGFNGIGVDGLAAAAGVTSGAFYSNFANKEAMLEKVIEACVGEPFVSADTGTIPERREKLKQWLAVYLSDFHRENPADGCVLPTLSADVARAGAPVRQAYAARMRNFVDRVMQLLDGDAADRERRAWSLIAKIAGAMAIARAMPDGKGAETVMRSALDTAYDLIA